jgi:hypothetical protein
MKYASNELPWKPSAIGSTGWIAGTSYVRRKPRYPPAPIKRENGGLRRRWRIPRWRATVDEDGHYSFAVAL